MSQAELSYEELKQEILKELLTKRTGVLATSDGEDVTAREVLIFSDELTIYCFTSPNSRKYKQMAVNPRVSIATGSLQIDGIASLRGHPLDEENARFIEIHKEQNPEYFKISESVHFKKPDSKVIQITPKRIGKWVRGGQIDILNITKKQAHRVEWAEIEHSPAYND